MDFLVSKLASDSLPLDREEDIQKIHNKIPKMDKFPIEHNVALQDPDLPLTDISSLKYYGSTKPEVSKTEPLLPNTIQSPEHDRTKIYEGFALKHVFVNLGFRVQAGDSGRVKLATHHKHRTGKAPPFPIGPYKCNRCHKMFFESLKLNRHIIRHHLPQNFNPSKPQFQCLECKSLCPTGGNLNAHWISHWIIKPFPCTHPGCHKSLSTNRSLQGHLITHSRSEGKPYKCKICPLKFRTKEAVKNHLKKSTEKRLECEICELKFCSRQIYNKHRRDHLNPERIEPKFYHCKICGDTMLQKLRNKHMQAHRVDKLPYHCTFCSKSFKEQHTLELHTRFHTEEKPYECQVCNKQFSQISNLRTHSNVHKIPRRQFQCPVCFIKMSSEIGLKKHRIMCGKISDYAIEIHTPCQPGKTGTSSTKKSVVTYQCRQCSHTNFKRAEYLREHVFRIHLKLKFFNCSYCKMEFVHKTELQIHLRSHTGEEPFKCKICGKGFKQSTHLKFHALVHLESLKDKKFRCFFCSKTFTHVNYLNCHIRLDTKERSYKCTHCPMEFDRSEGLKRHVNNHTGNRAFKCTGDGCSKAFLSNAELRGHKMTHTDERPFPCLVCDIACRNKGKLTKHCQSKSHKNLARKLEDRKGKRMEVAMTDRQLP